MIKLATLDLLPFVPSRKDPVLTGPLIIVGALKDATASSVQFSADNITNWLTLPTTLIEEAAFLGLVEEVEASQGTSFPLFSIRIKEPQTQSEHFFFNLVMPPFFIATKNSNFINPTELA